MVALFVRLSNYVVFPYHNSNIDVLRRPLESTQYLSIRYRDRLAEAGFEPSVGSKGDSYDNAMAESLIGLFKTEVINQKSSWRTFEEIEYATLIWIDWYNKERLHGALGYVPPVEFEKHTTKAKYVRPNSLT